MIPDLTRKRKSGKWVDRELRREIALRMRNSRKSMHLTLKQAAEHVGVSPQTVSMWESAASFPMPEKLTRLASLYEISIDWGLGLTDGNLAVAARIPSALQRAIGQRLRRSRKSKSLTLKRVAEECSVARQTVVNWETGRSSPSPEHLSQVVNVYAISLDWLFGRIPDDGEIAFTDPSLRVFFEKGWGALIEEEQVFVRGAIEMANKAKMLREAGVDYRTERGEPTE